MAMILNHDGVPFHWRRGDVLKIAQERSPINRRTLQHLELVTVQMPRVKVSMVVVDHNLDHLDMVHN